MFAIRSLAWTRDGRSIVYHAQQGALLSYLWRVPADGSGSPERIEEAGPSAWELATAMSRDRLAFSRSFLDIDVYSYDGTRSAPLLTSSFSDFQTDVSPDGRRVAFVSERSGGAPEVWIAGIDGSEAYQLTHGPGNYQGSPSWSPDGRRIAFDSYDAAADNRHIWTMDADGGNLNQVTKDSGSQAVPTWSNDGQWIYFAVERGGPAGICRIRPSGDQREQMTEGGGAFVRESADGKSLVYRPHSGDSPLLMMPLPHGQPRVLVQCVSAFNVRPSGVYYSPCVNGDDKPVHVLDSNIGRDRLIGTLEQAVFIPTGFAVTPDGKTILYERTVRSGSDLMLIENFR